VAPDAALALTIVLSETEELTREELRAVCKEPSDSWRDENVASML
jgi:hypothetical protein